MQALGLSRINGLHLLALYSLVFNHKPRLLLRRVNSLQDNLLLIWHHASSTAHMNVSAMLLIAETMWQRRPQVCVNDALVSLQNITSDMPNNEGVCSGHNDSVSASSMFMLGVRICFTSMSTSTCCPRVPYCLDNHCSSTVSIT